MFLDTNVLAAALGTRGLCHALLSEVLERHRLLGSTEVEVELERALRRKFGASPATAREAVEVLRRSWTRAFSRPRHEVPVPDAADAAIVSAAVNGGADVLVTGDAEFRGLGRFQGVEVLSPRAFWERIRMGGEKG